MSQPDPKRNYPLHAIYGRRLESLLKHANIDLAVAESTRMGLEFATARTYQVEDLSKYSFQLFETLIIFLHLERYYFGRGPGATKSALTELALQHNVASSRAIGTMLQRVIDLNRAQRWVDPLDKRIKHYIPTAALMLDHRMISLPMFAVLPLIGLDHPMIPKAKTDLTVYSQYRYQVSRLYVDGADHIRPFGIPRPSFSNRASGLSISHALRLANFNTFGRLTANEPCPINISHIADRLGISRAHVRNILQDLDADGLAHFEPGQSLLTFSDVLVDRLRRSMVCAMILCHEALLAMPDDIAGQPLIKNGLVGSLES